VCSMPGRLDREYHKLSIAANYRTTQGRLQVYDIGLNNDT